MVQTLTDAFPILPTSGHYNIIKQRSWEFRPRAYRELQLNEIQRQGGEPLNSKWTEPEVYMHGSVRVIHETVAFR